MILTRVVWAHIRGCFRPQRPGPCRSSGSLNAPWAHVTQDRQGQYRLPSYFVVLCDVIVACQRVRINGGPRQQYEGRRMPTPCRGSKGPRGANSRPLGTRGAPARRDPVAANRRTQGCEGSEEVVGSRQKPGCLALPAKRGGSLMVSCASL